MNFDQNKFILSMNPLLANCSILSFLSIIFITQSAFCQNGRITYYKDIEAIITKNCITCHYEYGPAPFSLTTYNDVSKRSEFIGHVTKIRYMPPWRADPEFQTYRNERLMSESDINTIQQWIASGSPKGFKSTQKTVPKKEIKADSPDLVLEMKPYRIETTDKDDFRFFNLPTGLPENQFVKKIEFIPGNKKLVHHSRVMLDTTHKVREIDGLSANDPRISNFEKYPPADKFFYGWVPGNFSTEFPMGTGKKLFSQSDIILNIHYSPNSKLNQTDQSKLRLYFSKEPVLTEVFSLAIAEENITNKPFIIKANEKITFYSKFGPLPVDIYAIAVLPHMHNLGKTFRSFAITPDGDAIMLIKINDWSINWQETYWFKDELKIPKGSIILVEADFDNTAENPSNPSIPPIDASYGWDTASEMLEMVIYYLLK